MLSSLQSIRKSAASPAGPSPEAESAVGGSGVSVTVAHCAHEAPVSAPANYHFPLEDELVTPRGKRFLDVLRRLLDRFEQYA